MRTDRTYRRGSLLAPNALAPSRGEGDLKVPSPGWERRRVRGAPARLLATIAWISLLFAHSRLRFLHSHPKAGSDERSTVRQAARTTRSRANVGTAVRTSSPAVWLLILQQETVLDRVHVRELRHPAAALGRVAAAVRGHGRRHVQAPPAELAQPPGEVRVLAVQEEVGVEVAGRDPGVLERRAPVEAGRAGRARDLLLDLVAALGELARAAVEVPARGREADPRRIEQPGPRQPGALGPVEPPRGRADVGGVRSVQAPRQDRGEVGLEPAVRDSGPARSGPSWPRSRRSWPPRSPRSRAGRAGAPRLRRPAAPRARHPPRRCPRGGSRPRRPAARPPSRARRAGPPRCPSRRR